MVANAMTVVLKVKREIDHEEREGESCQFQIQML